MSQATRTQNNNVSDATVQLKWRRQRSLRSRLLRIAIGVLVLALIGGGVWLVGFSSVFAVKSVSIKGTEVLSKDDVRQAAAIGVGTPLVRQDLEVITSRVQALRPVESVSVDRSWPNTVQIVVVERTGLFAVGQSGSYQLVDRFGVAFDSVNNPPQGVLTANVGAFEAALLSDVGVVVQALPEKLKGDVKMIEADSRDTIQLVLENGDRVIWGSADRSALKAQVATALVKRKATVYDVSSPANPTTR